MSINTDRVIYDLLKERAAQDRQWGEQNHPSGTGSHLDGKLAKWAREQTQEAAYDGSLTWKHILREEVYEVFAEQMPDLLRNELIQVIAVATAWVEMLDRQEANRAVEAKSVQEA